MAPVVLTVALAAGFVVAGSGSASADDAPLPPLPVPLPVDVPPLPVPLPAPTPPDATPPPLPVPTGDEIPPSLPDGVPTPAAGLPVPVPAGTPAPPSGTPDPTAAAAPVVGGLASAGGGADAVCDAVSGVGAVPTQAGTAAFLAVASSTPPEVTAALVPLLASAGGAGATPDPGELCQTVADTVTGVVGSLPGSGGGATTSPNRAGGTSTATNADVAAAGGGSGGASLAFTGAETWMLALAGLALAVIGTILLRARRFARSTD